MDGRYPELLQRRPCRERLVRVAARGARRQETDRSLRAARSGCRARAFLPTAASRSTSRTRREEMKSIVRPFDPAAPNPPAHLPAGAVADLRPGRPGMAFWRRDGKELYYLAAESSGDGRCQSTTSPQVEFGRPTAAVPPVGSDADCVRRTAEHQPRRRAGRDRRAAAATPAADGARPPGEEW